MVRSTALRAIGDVQTSFGDHLLNIAETRSEPGIQPDRMADNLRWKVVTFERELAHRASLMSIARPCHSSLCDNANERNARSGGFITESYGHRNRLPETLGRMREEFAEFPVSQPTNPRPRRGKALKSRDNCGRPTETGEIRR